MNYVSWLLSVSSTLHPDDPDNYSEKREFLMSREGRQGANFTYKQRGYPPTLLVSASKAAYHPLQSEG